jgi:hypothetical protein
MSAELFVAAQSMRSRLLAGEDVHNARVRLGNAHARVEKQLLGAKPAETSPRKHADEDARQACGARRSCAARRCVAGTDLQIRSASRTKAA